MAGRCSFLVVLSTPISWPCTCRVGNLPPELLPPAKNGFQRQFSQTDDRQNLFAYRRKIQGKPLKEEYLRPSWRINYMFNRFRSQPERCLGHGAWKCACFMPLGNQKLRRTVWEETQGQCRWPGRPKTSFKTKMLAGNLMIAAAVLAKWHWTLTNMNRSVLWGLCFVDPVGALRRSLLVLMGLTKWGLGSPGQLQTTPHWSERIGYTVMDLKGHPWG